MFLKNKHKFLRIFLICIALFLVISLVFTLVSPIPVSYLIRLTFNKSMAVAPENFDEMQNRVDVLKDLSYPSKYSDNTADIYVPKSENGNSNNTFPVILWIHGGAFVGGSKKDVEIYATALAAEGFAVVCMNYRRAPEAKYPTPLVQANDVYLWMKSVSDIYSFDISRFILAGDSAGAHVAAQFAAIQSNTAYAAEMGFEQVVPIDTLKAALLFCGPFDVELLDKSSNSIMNFFIGRAAWAYFGSKEWSEKSAHQATISNHITNDFPPTFITDGNNLSFEEHGRDLVDVLKQNGVHVESYFIPADIETAAHEYQFIMNTKAGAESFRRVVSFLEMQSDAILQK